MSPIEEVFKKLKSQGHAALIPFLVAGDPDLETTCALLWEMSKAGADLIEIGVPYSDPLADGPIIQNASQRALRQGVNLPKIFKLTEKLKGITTPLVLMSYFNPIFRYGLKAFAKDCRRHGIAGVIIPDLPPEEAEEWIEEARAIEVDTIFLTSPTSSRGRIEKIAKISRGFIYHVSLTGVTGARAKLSFRLSSTLKMIKKISQKPVAVGFGISTPQQARKVAQLADGVIVGSALVKIIGEEKNKKFLFAKIKNFLQALAATLHPPLGPP